MGETGELFLGIYDGTHDAGAALVSGGALVYACNEERFTRRKGQGGWPERSIAACLSGAGVSPRALAGVVFAGVANPNPGLRLARPLQSHFALDGADFYPVEDTARSRLSEWLQFDSPFPRLTSKGRAGRALSGVLAKYLRRALGPDFDGVPLQVADHHRCHAAAAWYTAGAERGLVVVADGVGDGLALTAWRGEGASLTPILEIPYPHSYGLFYASITGFLGFRPFRHEGKLTGLAAHGDARAVPLPFPFEGPPLERRFTQRFGAPLRRWLQPLLACRREDVCAWLQAGLEAELLGVLAALQAEQPGLRRVMLAGGVFANVRLNQKIAESGRWDEVFVFPQMGDGGLAAGAALQAAGRAPVRLGDVFLGPDTSEDLGVAALKAGGHPPKPAEPEDIAARLAAGQIVGRCAGRAEYGPRALGNRSILASAADPEMANRLNERLHRSEFMPFAPLVLEEAASEWLALPPSAVAACAWMTIGVQASPKMRAACPAAVHVDGSVRPQIVSARETPRVHAVLSAYAAKTGVPVLINTSFNMHEEPVILTQIDALRAFKAARLDALWLDPWLVEA